MCLTTHSFAQEGEKMTHISKVESRASIDVKLSEYKNYFTGDVRVDMLYPQSDAKTHSGAYVTFEHVLEPIGMSIPLDSILS